jgi:hypothetical protein
MAPGNHKVNLGFTDIIVDVETFSNVDLRKDLKLCFEIIDKTCSRRSSITPSRWPSMFYLLTAISIAKSNIINAHGMLENSCQGFDEV